jgi:leader peptidase (prepilin peptidase)/N-methyltransferase
MTSTSTSTGTILTAIPTAATPVAVGEGALPAIGLAVVLAAAGVVAGCAGRLLLGRLRRGVGVSPPWCEAGVAVAWGSTGALAGLGTLPPVWVPVLLALGWLAVAAGLVDVLRRRLPDALTLPALPITLLLLLPLGPGATLRGLAGAAVAVAAYAAVHLVAPAALGAGDVKLAAPLGAVLAAASWQALALGGLVASVVSGAAAVGLAWWRPGGRSWGAALPHGPAMLASAWVVVTAAAAARGP